MLGGPVYPPLSRRIGIGVDVAIVSLHLSGLKSSLLPASLCGLAYPLTLPVRGCVLPSVWTPSSTPRYSVGLLESLRMCGVHRPGEGSSSQRHRELSTS